MIQKEFAKLKTGDQILLNSGLKGRIVFFAKFLRNGRWAASNKKDSDGVYFEGLPPCTDTGYVHRVHIRRKL